MSYLYFINYAIFAAFLTLFVVEIGIALFFLFGHHRNETLRRYLMPIWPITGTFAVFYLVNFAATYPSSIPLLSAFYLPLILGAAAFFIFRDAFVAYGGYHWHDRMGPKYMRVYAIATLVTAFIVISILSSGVSGAGVSVASGSSNTLGTLFNPFGILLFAGIVFLALFAGAAIFDINHTGKMCPIFAVLGVILIFFALWWYLPSAIASVASNIIFVVVVAALLVATMFFGVRRNRMSKYLPFVWFFAAVNLFGALLYPYWFGGAVSSAKYLSNAVTWRYTLWITIIGGIFLTAAIACLIYVAYIKKLPARNKGGY